MTAEAAAPAGETHVVPGSAEPAAAPVSLPERRQEREYDVFISYSRKDKTFARLLYTELGSYKPPKSLPVVPTANQIRAYWWCSPLRIARQRMRPAVSTARDIGASLCNDK